MLAMAEDIEPQERLWKLNEAKWGLEAWPRPTQRGAVVGCHCDRRRL